MADPAWYARLPRAVRERWDQAGHAGAAFGLAFLGTAAAAWVWAHRREFHRQWPPATDRLPVLYVHLDGRPMPIREKPEHGAEEYLSGARVRDTRRDLGVMVWAAVAGQVVQIGAVVGIVVGVA